MFFQVKGDKDKNVGGFEDIWKEQATNFTLPYDTWMDIEIYILEGNEENGRFYMSVQPEGSPKTVLFDFYNYTHHPKEKCPDGFTHMQPLKLYTSDKVANYFKDNGNTLRVLWDDLELSKNVDPF